jgi:hypothetical protein
MAGAAAEDHVHPYEPTIAHVPASGGKRGAAVLEPGTEPHLESGQWKVDVRAGRPGYLRDRGHRRCLRLTPAMTTSHLSCPDRRALQYTQAA